MRIVMYRLLLCPFILIICLQVSAQNDLSRYPTIDEVATYLRSHLIEPPSGFTSYFWIEDEALLFADLNGDGEDDLIARGWLFVAVMLWEGNAYSAPLQVIYTADTSGGAWSHVELHDWTLDGAPDITFDRRIPIQGLDFGGNRFDRTIISCELLCYVAWEGQIAEYVEVASEKGIYLSQSGMTSSINASGRVVLDVITGDFTFHCRHAVCTVSGEIIEQDRFQAESRIGATIQDRYLWDGLEFLASGTIRLIDAHIMPSQSQLSTDRAQIMYEEDCQLWLDDTVIGESFPCVIDFTRIYWRDNFLVLEYAYFNEETIVIYDSSGEEQLRVSGVIRDEALFGVRLNGDMIISAGERYSNACDYQRCWFMLNQEVRFFEL